LYPGSGRLPGDLIRVLPTGFTAEQCELLAGELNPFLAARFTAGGNPEEDFCRLVIGAHAALVRGAGFYLPEEAELIGGTDGLWVAVPKIPCVAELSVELFQQLLKLCASTVRQRTPAAHWIGELRQQFPKISQAVLAVSHMARATYELGLPLLEIHGAFLQAGYGATGVAVTGSITENTPSMGIHLAREKSKANALLARAGFPIAKGDLVRDLRHALHCADALGYPVVVKPADLDGGIAVSSDVRTPAELEAAFAQARAASPRVMVEKHIHGTDHRLLMFGDDLLVALERTPGGVTGNGTDTVAQLLDELNRDPKRGNGAVGLLHQISFDEEAKLMLRRQGLTLESVPEADRFVPLRRAANHARGGMVRVVEHVHPDNVDLARRAMRLLRLDIAGLDIILPDVTRSWHETGGAICEVNAQPYIGEVIGRDYYKEILQSLVPKGGRIPLVLAVGSPDAATLGRIAQTAGCAIVDAAGARRDGHPLSTEGMPWLTACQAALYDRETIAALFILDPDQPAPLVSPADRFSAALVLESPPQWAESLLRRADVIYALDAACPALSEVGLEFEMVQKVAVAEVLATALA